MILNQIKKTVEKSRKLLRKDKSRKLLRIDKSRKLLRKDKSRSLIVSRLRLLKKKSIANAQVGKLWLLRILFHVKRPTLKIMAKPITGVR